MTITRAVPTPEVAELYIKYEKAVHKKDKTANDLVRHLCNSPVYDELKEPEIGSQNASLERLEIDQYWNRTERKDEGINI